jgi:hypothetical protein
VQTPATQVWLVHSTGAPHVPEAVHVWTPSPEHWTAPAVQVPEHAVPAQEPLAQATAVLQ